MNNVFSSDEVSVNGKVSYRGHASCVYSVDQSIEILDTIGARYDSEDCLPFAITLVEGSELICLAEDNGEFSAGELLSTALTTLDGFNALVCVTRKVSGCYVSDMVQSQKRRAIQEAANGALHFLFEHLTAQRDEDPSVTDFSLLGRGGAGAGGGVGGGVGGGGGGGFKNGKHLPERNVLQTKRVLLEPMGSFGTGLEPRASHTGGGGGGGGGGGEGVSRKQKALSSLRKAASNSNTASKP